MNLLSMVGDECEDISTQEELSICCRWLVNGASEEHFLTTLHMCQLDAEAITSAIRAFLESKDLDYCKLVGQAYN